MAGRRRAIELAIGEEDLAALGAIARSRTESASRVERARMLLAYREDGIVFCGGASRGAHHQTVQRCVERVLAKTRGGARRSTARPGREATITARGQSLACVLACPCFKARKDLGYPHQLWTTPGFWPAPRGRANMGLRRACMPCQAAQGTVCDILSEREIKPHQVRPIPGTTDPEFTKKMAGSSVRLCQVNC